MSVCYDQAGRNIGLADHAVASGGEGAVYEIVGYPRKVVKKYHHGADAKKREDKIREMVKERDNTCHCIITIENSYCAEE